MFEVPQRQQLKSIHRLLNVPPVATVKLGNAYQFEKFGTGNALLRYATHFQRPAKQPTPQTVDSLLGYATHFQRRAVPKAAPAHSGSRFSARNAHRSEVSKYKSG